RGHADQQSTAGGKELLRHQHSEGRADRAADDAEAHALLFEAPKLCVIAGPVRQGGGPAGSPQMPQDIAVRIEDADLRHGVGSDVLLTARLAQQRRRGEDGGSLMILVAEDRRNFDLLLPLCHPAPPPSWCHPSYCLLPSRATD